MEEWGEERRLFILDNKHGRSYLAWVCLGWDIRRLRSSTPGDSQILLRYAHDGRGGSISENRGLCLDYPAGTEAPLGKLMSDALIRVLDTLDPLDNIGDLGESIERCHRDL